MASSGPTTRGSFENVMRIHSSAMAADDSMWSHASRPNAYQLAWLKSEPVQSRSVPTLATPAMPWIAFATVEPGPWAYVSAWKTSSHSGARNARRLRSEEHTSELQSPCNLVCRLLLEKKKSYPNRYTHPAQRLVLSRDSVSPRECPTSTRPTPTRDAHKPAHPGSRSAESASTPTPAIS